MKMYVCVWVGLCVGLCLGLCVGLRVGVCVSPCVCVCLCMFPCFNTCTRSKFGNHKGCTSETKLFNQRGIETHFGHVNRFNHCMFWTFRNRFFLLLLTCHVLIRTHAGLARRGNRTSFQNEIVSTDQFDLSLGWNHARLQWRIAMKYDPAVYPISFQEQKFWMYVCNMPFHMASTSKRNIQFFPPARSRFLILSVSLSSFLRPSFLPSFLPAFLPSLILPPRAKISVGSVGPQLRTQNFNGHCQVSLGTAGPQPWTLGLSGHLSRTSRWPINYRRQLRSILPKKNYHHHQQQQQCMLVINLPAITSR